VVDTCFVLQLNQFPRSLESGVANSLRHVKSDGNFAATNKFTNDPILRHHAIVPTAMAASPQHKSFKPETLCGKLTTHDPDTYIVLCLHCLHYFRSLTDLLRHRLMNHNILDNISPGESLPRISKDGSWLVAGGDIEPQNPILPTPQLLPPPPAPGLRGPHGMPTPSPPPPPIHVPQFRSLGPHHQTQNPQFHPYNPTPPPTRPVQHHHHQFPHGPYRPQNLYVQQQMASNHGSPMASNHGSPIPSPGPQSRPPPMGQSTTTFSPAAREFVPSGMGFKMPFDDGQQRSGQSPSSQNTQHPGYSSSQGNEQGDYFR